ncbi:MAG TPA: IS4 family transposase [Trebonia sp.]|nr:IS4 family transposase [Trebonia sp.]
MPAYGGMPWGWSSARGRILSGGWLGALTYVIPPGLADEAVGDGLAWEMRLRSLPARLTLYFTLGLCLFGASPYQEVMRQVTAGLGGALAAAGWLAPATTSLSAARARLGEAPLRSLFLRLRSPLTAGTSPWSHVCGLLAVAVDGTTLAVRDTPANRAALGPPPGTADVPRLRLVALVAVGARALLDAAAGPAWGPGSGEQSLAGDLLGSLRAGMLVLADRNFYSWKLWNAAAGTGAGLLWRVTSSLRLRFLAELPDGSWLAHVDDPAAVQARNRRNGMRRRRGSRLPPETGPLPGITVRVIEYHLTVTADDGTTRTERYRHITSLLDHAAFPARELAAAYALRWQAETAYAECKTYLQGSGRPLRSGTPGLARQELWALLCVYQAVRALIARAAAGAGADPGRCSFTAALHAARRTMGASRRHLSAAAAQAEAEILAAVVPRRPGRVYPRAVKQPSARYPSRATAKTPVSQHATYTTATTTPAPATRTSPHQRKQPQPALNHPP